MKRSAADGSQKRGSIAEQKTRKTIRAMSAPQYIRIPAARERRQHEYKQDGEPKSLMKRSAADGSLSDIDAPRNRERRFGEQEK